LGGFAQVHEDDPEPSFRKRIALHFERVDIRIRRLDDVSRRSCAIAFGRANVKTVFA
jgi:hypothetical protein